MLDLKKYSAILVVLFIVVAANGSSSTPLNLSGTHENATLLREAFAKGSAIPKKLLIQKPRWYCEHAETFQHDFFIQPQVTLSLSTYGAIVNNDGTFDVRIMINTPVGLHGKTRLREYEGIWLRSNFKMIDPGNIVGELTLEKSALTPIDPHGRKPQKINGPAALTNPNQIAFYYTHCTPED